MEPRERRGFSPQRTAWSLDFLDDELLFLLKLFIPALLQNGGFLGRSLVKLPFWSVCSWVKMVGYTAEILYRDCSNMHLPLRVERPWRSNETNFSWFFAILKKFTQKGIQQDDARYQQDKVILVVNVLETAPPSGRIINPPNSQQRATIWGVMCPNNIMNVAFATVTPLSINNKKLSNAIVSNNISNMLIAGKWFTFNNVIKTL